MLLPEPKKTLTKTLLRSLTTTPLPELEMVAAVAVDDQKKDDAAATGAGKLPLLWTIKRRWISSVGCCARRWSGRRNETRTKGFRWIDSIGFFFR